jgi:hypothetical protein
MDRENVADLLNSRRAREQGRYLFLPCSPAPMPKSNPVLALVLILRNCDSGLGISYIGREKVVDLLNSRGAREQGCRGDIFLPYFSAHMHSCYITNFIP